MPYESTAPSNAMPYGHAPYRSPLGGIDIGTPKYSYASQYSRNVGRYFNGAVFNQTSPDGILELPRSARDTSELFQPLPANPFDAGRGFYMDKSKDLEWTGSYVEEVDGVTTVTEVDPIPVNPSTADELLVAKLRRFVVGFQGGFDGQSPAHPINLGKDISETNVQGLDCSREFSSGTKGYKRGFNLSNQDEFDINLLVTPNLTLDLHRSVINRGVDLCEQREDCFYILDCVSAHNQPGRVDDAVQQVSTIDSNYATTYYPWVKIIDPATNVLQPYPPSSLMMAVYVIFNDKSSAEWFAPAGLNRGGIEQAVAVMDRLNFAERDTLYEGKVNPIVIVSNQGIVAFGQKTLQRRSSALDRVNARCLLITLKKFIASSARFLLFEQNVASTRNRFLSIVNPYLENVQQRHGLYAFRVIMDESNNTPDLIDRNILYGQIFLQPARS